MHITCDIHTPAHWERCIHTEIYLGGPFINKPHTRNWTELQAMNTIMWCDIYWPITMSRFYRWVTSWSPFMNILTDADDTGTSTIKSILSASSCATYDESMIIKYSLTMVRTSVLFLISHFISRVKTRINMRNSNLCICSVVCSL